MSPEFFDPFLIAGEVVNVSFCWASWFFGGCKDRTKDNK